MNVQIKKYCGKCQKHKPHDAFSEGSRICKVCTANRKAAIKSMKQGINKQVGGNTF